MARRVGNVLYINKELEKALPLEKIREKFTLIFVSDAAPQFKPIAPTNLVIAALEKLKESVKGKIFIDLGAGSQGNIGLLAGKLGAKKVIFIEREVSHHASIIENAERDGISYGIFKSIAQVPKDELNQSVLAQNLGYDFGLEGLAETLKHGTPDTIISAGGYWGEHQDVQVLLGNRDWRHDTLALKLTEPTELNLDFAAVISSNAKRTSSDVQPQNRLIESAL
jgi:hypothetical protein